VRISNQFNSYFCLRLQYFGIKKAELGSQDVTTSSTGLTPLKMLISECFGVKVPCEIIKSSILFSQFQKKKRDSFFTLITHCNLIDKVFLSRFFGAVFLEGGVSQAQV